MRYVLLLSTIVLFFSTAQAKTIPVEKAKIILAANGCQFGAVVKFLKPSVMTGYGQFTTGEAQAGAICIGTSAFQPTCQMNQLNLVTGAMGNRPYRAPGQCTAETVHFLISKHVSELQMIGGSKEWVVGTDQFGLASVFSDEIAGRKTIKKFVYSRSEQGNYCTTSIIGDVETFLKEGTVKLVSRNANHIVVHDARPGFDPSGPNEIWYASEPKCELEAKGQKLKEEAVLVAKKNAEPKVLEAQFEMKAEAPSGPTPEEIGQHRARQVIEVGKAAFKYYFFGAASAALSLISSMF